MDADTLHDFSFKVGGSRKGPRGQPLPVGPYTVDGAKGVPCDQWTCRQAVSPTHLVWSRRSQVASSSTCDLAQRVSPGEKGGPCVWGMFQQVQPQRACRGVNR